MNFSKNIIWFFLFTSVLAQGNGDSATVFLGKEYNAGFCHKLLFGEHWRDVWTTPVKVKILNPDKFAGGLAPFKLGGGMATKSLRFKGADNKYWKFRTINKDPSKALDEDLRNSKLADILKDQTSSSFPLAPLVVTELLRPFEILQAEPLLFLMPESESLGDYKEIFMNQPGFIEEHPDEDGAGFYDAKKILGTFKLFNRLSKKTDEKIDSKEFLKIRLIDILIGDWDRHTDQWRWALYEIENKKIWRPIPRDRDQAFAKFDGLFPAIAAYIIPQFTHFSEDYPQIEDLTWSGRFLDRRILNSVDYAEWRAIALEVKRKLADSVLFSAVNKLPAVISSISGKELYEDLKIRRDKLLIVADEYYNNINKYVDIYGSSGRDSLFINYSEEYTKVELKSEKDVLFSRQISNKTREIRSFLDEGDDIVIIKGDPINAPLFRICGEEGRDEYIDNSIERAPGLIAQIFQDEKINIYDGEMDTKFITNGNIKFDNSEYKKHETDEERYEPQQIDRGHEWIFIPTAEFTSENGLILGGGPRLYKYGFRVSPYIYSQTATFEYAFRHKTVRLKYHGEFFSLINNASINIDIENTGMLLFKYFGYGNNTLYDRHLEEKGYFDLEQELFFINPSITFYISKFQKLTIGSRYSYSSTIIKNKNLLNNFPNNENASGRYQQLDFNIDFISDKRNSEYFAQEGYYFSTKIKTAFPVFNKNKFIKCSIDLRKYFSFNLYKKHSLALRTTSEKIWGDFPYYESVFLGGKYNLRGFSYGRFSGNTSVSFQADLRISLINFNFFVPVTGGINISSETGRVFTDNEDSKEWHASMGGGMWFRFFKDEYTIGLSFSSSKERNIWYFNIGLGF